jgi:hypothetical protein
MIVPGWLARKPIIPRGGRRQATHPSGWSPARQRRRGGRPQATHRRGWSPARHSAAQVVARQPLPRRSGLPAATQPHRAQRTAPAGRKVACPQATHPSGWSPASQRRRGGRPQATHRRRWSPARHSAAQVVARKPLPRRSGLPAATQPHRAQRTAPVGRKVACPQATHPSGWSPASQRRRGGRRQATHRRGWSPARHSAAQVVARKPLPRRSGLPAATQPHRAKRTAPAGRKVACPQATHPSGWSPASQRRRGGRPQATHRRRWSPARHSAAQVVARKPLPRRSGLPAATQPHRAQRTAPAGSKVACPQATHPSGWSPASQRRRGGRPQATHRRRNALPQPSRVLPGPQGFRMALPVTAARRRGRLARCGLGPLTAQRGRLARCGLGPLTAPPRATSPPRTPATLARTLPAHAAKPASLSCPVHLDLSV